MTLFNQIVANLEESDNLIVALEKDIDKLRQDIAQRLKDQKCDQKELKRIFNRLNQKGKQILNAENELDKILKKSENSGIEDLQNRLKNDQEKLHEIQSYDSFFIFVNDLYENIKQYKDKFELHEFFLSNIHLKKAFELYDKIQQSISTKNCDSTTSDAFKIVCTSIKNDIDLVQEKFICDFIQIYKNCFNLDSEHNIFNCNFNQQLSRNYESFIECLLEEQSNFGVYFQNTCTIVSEHFVIPILAQNCLPLVLTHDGKEHDEYNSDFCAITLRTTNESFSDNEIIEHLERFIRIFLQILTNDFTISSSKELSLFVGKHWYEQISEALIKHFFELRLPKNELYFENFAQVLKKGSHVIEFMHEIKMISTSNTEIFDTYLNNVKDNFALKVSQDFLIRVKRAIKSDLNDFVSSDDALKIFKLKTQETLPKLMISKFMINLQEIFEEMSALIDISSQNLKILLSEDFTNVCELFVSICPFVFKINVECDPRQNVLFHNNCLYFAYLVEAMVSTHKPLLNDMATYLPSIRNLASQVFAKQRRRSLYKSLFNRFI